MASNSEPCIPIRDADGAPKTVALRMRESTTASHRIKATFTVDSGEGLTVKQPGDEDLTRLPAPEATELPLSHEFRIELN